MREGLTVASMIAPFFHLYTKDDGPPSTGYMAMAPFLEDLPLHCHYNQKHLWIEGLT